MMMGRSATFVALAILTGTARGWWNNACQECGDVNSGGLYLATDVELLDVYPPYFYKGKCV